MVQTHPIPELALNAIAEQVGRLFPLIGGGWDPPRQVPKPDQTYQVWFLPADAIAAGTTDFLARAQNTERWHCQIWWDSKPMFVARFIVRNGDTSDLDLRQVLVSEYANSIDEAIRWVDTNVEGNPLIRILDIPALYITALWLIEEDENRLVIARISGQPHVMKRLEPYAARDFLAAVQQEREAMRFSA